MATEPVPETAVPAEQAPPSGKQRAHWPEVLTLEETAEFLRLRVSAVERLAREKVLPGRRVEGKWLFLRRALEEWLLGKDDVRDSRTRLLDVCGILKNDETLTQLREAIYKARGRPEAEEGAAG